MAQAQHKKAPPAKKPNPKSHSTSIIQNFGLFWEREAVSWDRRSKNGGLLGVRSKTATELVDFANQVGFYGLYDRNLSLVYFGQVGGGKSGALLKRLRDHHNNQPERRWTSFSWFGIKYVKGDGELKAVANLKLVSRKQLLDEFEGLVLYASEPPLNLQRGRLGGADRYLQLRAQNKWASYCGLFTHHMGSAP